jgi:hypothetical protein
MRTITALGVAISARAQQQTSSVLAAVGAVVAVWIVQAIILFALTLAGSTLFAGLAFFEMMALQVVIFTPTFLLMLIAAAIYGFYSVVQTWSLRRAERWVARSE